MATDIQSSAEPSQRALVLAAALAVVVDAAVWTSVRPKPLRMVVRLAIPVVVTRPLAGVLTRMGV
jgi:hypothetical protein